MDYSEALKRAPKWIKDAYLEFQKLSDLEKSKTPFLYFVLGKGKGTPPFKMSKKDAGYVDPSANPKFICGNCIFYYINPVKKIGVCSQVRGNVEYDAYCKLWVGKESL
jgi:hypothetical protein